MFRKPEHERGPRSVIITGSSAGIGAATAVQFAEERAKITLHGRQVEALERVKQDCLKAGATQVIVVAGEITDCAVQQRLVNDTVQHFGGIDVLVNNVGIFIEDKSNASPIDSYDRQFEINVRSVVSLTNLAVPHLLKSKGNIVNISSALAVIPLPSHTYYCMTKAAINHFTRCLATELGPKGVRINTVAPAYIKGTEIQFRHGVKPPIDLFEEAVKNTYPLRRVGEANEVADAIIFLASDKATFITGVTLPVDGGAGMR